MVACKWALWTGWWQQNWAISHCWSQAWFDCKQYIITWLTGSAQLKNHWILFLFLPIRTCSSSASTLTFRIQIVVISKAFARSRWEQSVNRQCFFSTYLWFIQATVTSPPTILNRQKLTSSTPLFYPKLWSNHSSGLSQTVVVKWEPVQNTTGKSFK